MSAKISQTRYLILGSAIILAVLMAGCTAGPSGVPPTPAATMTTTPAPVSTAAPQATQVTTPAPASTSVSQETQATTPVETVNQTPTPPTVTTIAIQNYSFNPDTVTITAGTTVTWTNYDPVHHQVSSQGSGISAPGTIFMSDSLGKGDSYSFTFTTPGVYPYFDSIYRSMLGTITVT